MIRRRELLQLSLGLALLPAKVFASNSRSSSIEWETFLALMKKLAASKVEQDVVVRQGMRLIKQLNLDSAEFVSAVNESFETGNQYWQWQRMVKERDINGGIITIEGEQTVQLHDHPGASGMMRIITGETEVWQFDLVASSISSDDEKITQLKRISHRVLRPGDTAILTADAGNIHALRAVSKQCSMLDFFIPPYQRSQRSWYEPVDKNWFNSETITCRSIPQHEYTMA